MPDFHHDPLNNGSTPNGTGDLLSIGELSRATGLSIDTLRVWERRYGRPVPVRLPSGHRRISRSEWRMSRTMLSTITPDLPPVVALSDMSSPVQTTDVGSTANSSRCSSQSRARSPGNMLLN